MFLPHLLRALFPLIPSIIVLFLFTNAAQAQFPFDNLLEGFGMEAAQKIINSDLGEQNDPLRKVFGIWGRLLNRMAQKNPPSDDELHLKGAQEGDQEEGNVIGEDPEGLNFPPKGGGFGGGSAKLFAGGSAKQFAGGETASKTSPSGPNRIIDEQRLNELLPRLNPNYAKEEKLLSDNETTTQTTTATTEPKVTTTETRTTAKATTTMAMIEKTAQLKTANETKEEDQKMAKKYKRKKKGKRKSEKELQNKTKTNMTTTKESQQPTTPMNTSAITTIVTTITTTTTTPVNYWQINETNGTTQNTSQNQNLTTKVGTTIQLRTSAEEKSKGQMEIKRENEFAGLNVTVLERAENETAQLIAEIENVLADAEMGPNGHWLKQQTEDRNMTTTRSWSSTVTFNEMEGATTTDARNKTNKEEQWHQQQKEEDSYEEEQEEGVGREEEEGESYETDESEEAKEKGENGAVQHQPQQKRRGNTTMQETTAEQRTSERKEGANAPEETAQTMAETTTTTTTTVGGRSAESPASNAEAGKTQKANGNKKGIPEAEEEEQHQQQQIAAQLQLDSAVTVSSPSPTTAQQTPQSPQSGQNIFNLNANSNSYANPNLTNVMKPVNSIIDGIGPLILPLIGYSQRAFDAYAPFVAQRSEGLPLFRPPAMAAAPVSQQQTNPMLPIGTSFSSVQQSTQLPYDIPSSPSPSGDVAQTHQTHHSSSDKLEMAKEAPSLEVLGRIIEERRKNEQKHRGSGNGRTEISGSSPPEAELAYFPPNLLSNGPTHPFDHPVPERPVKQKADRGFDAGRQTVHDTFHEDSGLMLGTQQTQNDRPTLGPTAFGNGKRPNGALGGFTRR